MPEKHESQLLCCTYTDVVRVERDEGVIVVGRRWRIQPENLVIVDGVVCLIVFARDARSGVLVGQAQDCEPGDIRIT
jgi:hypothetical protein